jgi:hypothetical protein
MEFSRVPLFLILLIMTLFLVCTAAGDNEPVMMVTLTANSSVITHDENDTYVITLNDVNSNATMSDENQTNWIIPLTVAIPNETSSAAVVLSGIDGNESTFMGRVSFVKYSADLKSLSMNLTPLKYYDGTILHNFSDNTIEIHPGNYSTTSIHIESMIPIPTNEIICREEWYTGKCMYSCYETNSGIQYVWIPRSSVPCSD